jgi:hypothetical protein
MKSTNWTQGTSHLSRQVCMLGSMKEALCDGVLCSTWSNEFHTSTKRKIPQHKQMPCKKPPPTTIQQLYKDSNILADIGSLVIGFYPKVKCRGILIPMIRKCMKWRKIQWRLADLKKMTDPSCTDACLWSSAFENVCSILGFHCRGKETCD